MQAGTRSIYARESKYQTLLSLVEPHSNCMQHAVGACRPSHPLSVPLRRRNPHHIRHHQPRAPGVQPLQVHGLATPGRRGPGRARNLHFRAANTGEWRAFRAVPGAAEPGGFYPGKCIHGDVDVSRLPRMR